MLTRRLLLGTLLALSLAGHAAAQSWPNKPIRVILPGTVGGLVDIGARSVADILHKELGQPLLIDPRPGANGLLAAQTFLGAPADGYTLYLTVSAHVALPFLMKVPFDVMADFKPIAMIGVSTALICVPPSSPAKTVADFVLHAKAHPGKLNYLNSGNGTGSHLVPELLKIKYGLDVASIYYKGLPPGVQDLLGERIDFGVVSAPLVVHHVKSGRLKALAVVGPQRLAELPDVATMTEQGVGDCEVRSSLPLFGHRSLPDNIVARMNSAMTAALADPEALRRLAAAYIQPLPMQASELASLLGREHVRMRGLIERLGIKADGS
jgi:tripartite-type tricarboxylate transporter receptor subunit TctC